MTKILNELKLKIKKSQEQRAKSKEQRAKSKEILKNINIDKDEYYT